MSKRQDVEGALEEEGGQRDSTRRSGARRAHSAGAEETDALSVPQKEISDFTGNQRQSCVFRGTARNPPPEHLDRSVTGATQGAGRKTSSRDREREAQGGETRAMFGMIKNSLFGNTEKTEYKLLSSETKVRGVQTRAFCQS